MKDRKVLRAVTAFTCIILGAAVIVTGALGGTSALKKHFSPKEVSAQVAALSRSSVSDFVTAPYNGGVAITDYTGTAEIVDIPSSIGGLAVKAVGNASDNRAFEKKFHIITVNVPASVQEIVPGSFVLCEKLTTINIDSANPVFTSVDGVVFNKSMTRIVVCPSGISGVYTIPESVDTVGVSAFEQCFKLTQVNMYDNVKVISDKAFAYCGALKKIVLSDNLNSIGANAFRGCGELTSVTIPRNVTSIGGCAFLFQQNSDDTLWYKIKIICVEGNSATAPGSAFARSLGSYPLEYCKDIRCDEKTGISVEVLTGTLPLGARLTVKLHADGTEKYNEALSNMSSVAFRKFACAEVYFEKDGSKVGFDGMLKIGIPVPSGFAPAAGKIYYAGGSAPLAMVTGNSGGKFYFNSVDTGLFAIIQNAVFDKKGDVDGDGNVTAADARIALRAATKLESLSEEQLVVANVDGHAGVSAADARIILRVATKLESF
ncbi:MAG: leucine-rich repeat protein [Clostridiales bacterium]|nr:leucine-rich repeat protein [Clostridiales bacterium]